ncbi:MAG: serine/threonine-protein phosphatase [Candidatus Hydrogenedens sp.]|nr:serine/threonine-protein phosphatase [Candidatus Hydrogenedens sp.]
MTPSTGLPVGLAPSAYEEATVQMAPGDTLVLYSDGITDVLDGEKRPFGRTRLARHFIEGAGAPLGDTLDGLMASLETWRGGAAFADDLSLLAFRIRSE